MSRSMEAEAARWATDAHFGQYDKAFTPYIEHVRRVAMTFPDGPLQVVGWLHDIVEDGDVTLSRIATSFGDNIANAVDALTRIPGQSYNDYLVRVKANPMARLVKLADLADNLDRSRLPNPTERDRERWEKYERATVFLEGRMTTVDPELHR